MVLKINQSSEGTEYSSFPESDSWERDLFRLDDDSNDILSSLSKDPTIDLMIKKYPGLRLLRQDSEQCLFSFLCSSNTNIPMIRRMLYNLSRKFGKRVICDGREFFTFPSAASLGRATMAELRSCGLGYRAKAVKHAAESIVKHELDLHELRKVGYREAKNALLQVYGIGNKIADCVLLFSLDKLDAFPIDVWISRALSMHYQNMCGIGIKEKLTASQYETTSSAVRAHFGRYAGYAQQYLYYDIRNSRGRSW
jgi:N-glycosylase/DNA lyase